MTVNTLIKATTEQIATTTQETTTLDVTTAHKTTTESHQYLKARSTLVKVSYTLVVLVMFCIVGKLSEDTYGRGKNSAYRQ